MARQSPLYAEKNKSPPEVAEDDSDEFKCSAVPDPKNPKCNDRWFYIGDSVLSKLPKMVKNKIASVAPPEIAGVKGGVERACLLFLLFQMGVGALYWFSFASTLRSCFHTSFLSLDKTAGICDPISIIFSESYYIDDAGFWDTSYNWGFANTMVGVFFQGYTTDTSEWRKTKSVELYNQISTWNTQWGTQPVANNLLAMVASEHNIAKSGILLVHIVADPIAIMSSNFKDALAFNGRLNGGSVMPLTYQENGDQLSFTAASSSWDTTFPKWKFGSAGNVFVNDDASSSPQGVALNKYSIWVAAAVNLGIISIKNLTNLKATSLAAMYQTVSDDDSSSAAGSGLPSGVTCANPSGFKDGFCDASNNVPGCEYDGGDCCASTCGAGYDVGIACGSNGYTCLDPSADDTGSTVAGESGDDAAAFYGSLNSAYYGSYYVSYYGSSYGSYYGSYYGGSPYGGSYYSSYYRNNGSHVRRHVKRRQLLGTTCDTTKNKVLVHVEMSDSGNDGWEGNFLNFDKNTKVTLHAGSSGKAGVCLSKDKLYSPYCCGGRYPSEVSWEFSGFFKLTNDITTSSHTTIPATFANETIYGSADVLCHKKVSFTLANKAEATSPFPTKMPVVKPAHPPTRSPHRLTTRKPTSQPTHLPTKIGTTFKPTQTPTHIQPEYQFELEQYVLFKYYENMDPINCAVVNGSDFCWIKEAGEKHTQTEYKGAYLFPIIQHYNTECYNCSHQANSKTSKTTGIVCNNVDLEILLFFNPELASSPHFVRTQATSVSSHSKAFIPQGNKWTVFNSGLDGVLYLNLYDGVHYLNDLFYALPKTHCTKPVKLANGGGRNKLACGSSYQKHTLKTARTRNSAKKTYCFKPPLPPQQAFYSCKYSTQDCVSQSFAAASGQAGILAAVLAVILVSIANAVLGIPAIKNEDDDGSAPDGADNFTAAFLSLNAYLRGKCIKSDEGEAQVKDTKEVEMKAKNNQAKGLSIEARVQQLSERVEQLASKFESASSI